MLTKFLAISFSTFLVSRHLGKGLFKLLVDRLELLLLGHQLVLKAVHLATVYSYGSKPQGKIALHLLFGWNLDKDKKSFDQSKQFS